MEDDLYIIDRKLAGELTPPEEETFAQRLRRDPEFAEQYALGQAMIQSLRDHHLKEEMRGWIRAADRRRRRQRWQYGLAAGLALLLLAAGGWYLGSTQPTPQSLYETYYTVYPADPVLRGEPTVDYNQAMTLYREGRYREAIPLFEELQRIDDSDVWVALFLGNSHLNVDQTDDALRYFGQVAASDDAIIQQYGRWYLALTHLKRGEQAAAQALLISLNEQPGMFRKKAQALLSEL